MYDYDHRNPLKVEDPSVHHDALGKAAVFCSLFSFFFYPAVLATFGLGLGIICLIRRDLGFGILAVAMGLTSWAVFAAQGFA